MTGEDVEEVEIELMMVMMPIAGAVVASTAVDLAQEQEQEKAVMAHRCRSCRQGQAVLPQR